MINLNLLERYRLTGPSVIEMFGWTGDAYCGMFVLKSIIDRGHLRVIASNGEGWDHVSVSRSDRCPWWEEMSQIKRMFFKSDELVMQLHPATKDHINCHPNCLHLWRPHNEQIPTPPKYMVGL